MGNADARVIFWATSLAALAVALLPSAAAAQQASPPEAQQMRSDEIVVTAQKREQSINDVPITITAASGDSLKERGITSVADLPRLVPGFTVAESAFNSTSYTLRGVGFFNNDLATPPAVSVYVDEGPLPYPAMTKLTAFDLERVEVLKGPQGILYGQNATGGAINYIAAKPTKEFDAGLDVGYGRFNRFTGSGFVSGPLSESLSARLALQGRTGDPWQISTTRPDDKLGRIREFQGRATLDWHPGAEFRSRLTLTYTHDGSDTIAPQLQELAPVVPALDPPAFFALPIVHKPRAADWTPGIDYSRDNNLYNATWRSDYDINNNVTLTSLTTYSHYTTHYSQDTDGTPFVLLEIGPASGKINSIFQELRLAGHTSRFNWLVGANYDHDSITDRQPSKFFVLDTCQIFRGIDPNAACTQDINFGKTKVDTYGIFARAEYKFTDTLGVEAGIRYNNDKRDYNGCVFLQDDTQVRYFNLFQSFVNGGIPITPLQIGGCQVLDPFNQFKPVPNVAVKLHEDNISWRGGINWKPVPGTLLYASISRGYKAGTVPVVGAATTIQYTPVKQESVIAYEAGVKASLLDRILQFNAAGFYYDYKDKQLRGLYLDPFFQSALEALVSIPKSHVVGFEAQLVARPTSGLVLDTSVTYVKSRIDRFIGFGGNGTTGDQKGSPFPFSPRWQSVTDLGYNFPVSSSIRAFLGGALTYNSKTYSAIGAPQQLKIDGYALLDLRAGVETADGRYRLSLWGKNVTNKYYWSSAYHSFSVFTRFVGSPATYGLTLSYRYR